MSDGFLGGMCGDGWMSVFIRGEEYCDNGVTEMREMETSSQVEDVSSL